MMAISGCLYNHLLVVSLEHKPFEDWVLRHHARPASDTKPVSQSVPSWHAGLKVVHSQWGCLMDTD